MSAICARNRSIRACPATSSGPAWAAVHEGQRLLERTGGRLGLRRVDRASCPPSSVGGQRGRRLQTGGCCRKPAVRERSVSGAHERCRDRFVCAHRRPGAVPCSAVRVDVRVGDLGEGTVDLPPFRRCRRVVDRRADERMPKPDAIAQLDQPGRLGRGRRIGTDAQLIRRPPPQDDVAHRLRGRSQQQLPGRPWEEAQLAHEPSLEAVDQGPGVARPGAPEDQLRRRQAPRQLQESKRIAVGLGHDAVPHAGIESPGHHRLEQCCGIAAAQRAHDQFREPGQPGLLGLAYGEDHGHRFCTESTSDELERLRRRAVQPLRVVHHADQWLLLGHESKQAQHRQAQEEAIRGAPRPQAECRAQCVPLRGRQPAGTVNVRTAQLVQTRVRELHLRLDARSARHPAGGGAIDQKPEQGCLADAGLAA